MLKTEKRLDLLTTYVPELDFRVLARFDRILGVFFFVLN